MVEDRGAMAAMDPEMVVGLAVGAVQAVGMEPADELVVAGALIHEVGDREVHGCVSRMSVGLRRVMPCKSRGSPTRWLTEFAS